MNKYNLKEGQRVYWSKNFEGYKYYEEIRSGNLICIVKNVGTSFVDCFLQWKKGYVTPHGGEGTPLYPTWLVPVGFVIPWDEQELTNVDGDYYK